MRVDEMAAARANMRARTSQMEGGKVLTLSDEEIAAIHNRQFMLNHCLGACGTCCRLAWVEPPDGSRIACPLIMKEVPMNPEERAAAESCQMPMIYHEVFKGDRKDLLASQALEAIPFDVPEHVIEMAKVREAVIACSSGTYAVEQAQLLVSKHLWDNAWGKPPDAGAPPPAAPPKAKKPAAPVAPADKPGEEAS